MSKNTFAIGWDDDRLARDCLLLWIGVVVVAALTENHVSRQISLAIQNAGLVAAAAAAFVLVYWRLLRGHAVIRAAHAFLDRRAGVLLTAWIALLIAWSGAVIFTNPYQYEYNGGDGGFFSQTLWNLVHGGRPETSWLTLNGVFTANDDPRYPDAYGYASIFTLHQFWLPLITLTPLYTLYPHPPMHVFAVQLLVLCAGLPGMYWAARQAGASRVLALGAGVGYSVLPQVGTQLFFMGYMDVTALAVLPWLFGAMLGRRWRLLYAFAGLTALVSFPAAVFTIFAGIALLTVPGARRHAIVVTLIGALVLSVDSRIMTAALTAYNSARRSTPSLLKAFVIDRSVGSLVPPAAFNLAFVGYLFEASAFLPLVVLFRHRARTDRRFLGVLAFLCLVFVPMLFRSYSWQFQRNGVFIVPAFILGVVSSVILGNQTGTRLERKPSMASMMFLCAMIPMTLVGNPFRSGPLRSHYPWGSDLTLAQTAETRRWNATLHALDSIVPRDASLAWDAEPEVTAYMTARRDSWYVGREPRGVEFYAFAGDPRRADGLSRTRTWLAVRARVRRDPSFRTRYIGNPGHPLEIYENLRAGPIPRDERLLGWSLVWRPFLSAFGMH